MKQVPDKIAGFFTFFRKNPESNRILKFFSNPNRAYTITLINCFLAFLLLGWFYQEPFVKNVLTEQPKTFNLVKFKPKTRYLLRQNDYIRGTSTPQAKIKVLLTNPKIKIKTSADKNGNWRIRIPAKLNPRPYKMTTITFDKNGTNPKIRTGKIKVESNNKFYSSKLYKNLNNFYKKNLQQWI